MSLTGSWWQECIRPHVSMLSIYLVDKQTQTQTNGDYRLAGWERRTRAVVWWCLADDWQHCWVLLCRRCWSRWTRYDACWASAGRRRVAVVQVHASSPCTTSTRRPGAAVCWLTYTHRCHVCAVPVESLWIWYGMVNVDLYSAIITKVSNALNTLISGEKPGFQTLSKGLIVLLCAEVVRQGVPDHGAVHSECSASNSR